MERNHDAEIEARLQAALARAHRPLTPDELTLVRQQIELDLKNRADMRALPLANGDAPDPSFSSPDEVRGGQP